MKTKTLLTTLLFLTLTMTPAYCQITKEMPKVKLTALIVDDEGNPIKNADVALGDFTIMNITPNPPLYVEGKSNEKGEFTGEISSFWGSISVRAKKEKYYANESEKIQLYKTVEENLKALETGSWGPVKEPLKVVLRPKKNPIPMYVRRFNKEIPTYENWVGFDLEMGACLPPYGGGKIKDIEIRSEGEWDSKNHIDYRTRLRFVNPNDGIIKFNVPKSLIHSEFAAPYNAPIDGYINEISWKKLLYIDDNKKVVNIDETKDSDDERSIYIFRIRTAIDKDGSIKNAMYGRISALKFGMEFTYYLNPAGTRNLEYDDSIYFDDHGVGKFHNLFKNDNTRYPP